MHLLIMDTAQIQPYVFGSNRLRENIGASYLVAQATGEWALERLPKPNNVKNAARLELDDGKRIEEMDLQSEALYVGGGNLVALFRDADSAAAFTKAYSRCLLQRAPGLQVVFWHEPFEWDGQTLAEAVGRAFQHLARKKQSRTYSAPQLGLGVTEMCRSTALPAVAQSPSESDAYPVSGEVLAKEKRYKNANGRLTQYMKETDGADRDWLATYLEGYEFPYDFDNLGRSEGEQSYIAIVHADGDGMGKRFRTVGAGKPNREYIQAVRDFSRAIQTASQEALQDTVRVLIGKLQGREKDVLAHRSAFGDLLAEVVLTEQAPGIYYLPFRPIVFGGDDVTFVCDGRLALSLALEYMKQFAAHAANLPDGKGGATASAGVVIVKSHYPFAQAYGIAEALINSAKQYRREQGVGACLDWHFARSGISGSLKTVREREYRTPDNGWLTLRPVTLQDNPEESHRAWPVVEKGVAAFQDLYRAKKRKADWSSRRNKVKALRETLREGPAAVRKFRAKFNENKLLPDVASDMSNWPESGWQGGFCGYFDAIEMMDWFIPLHEIKEEQA